MSIPFTSIDIGEVDSHAHYHQTHEAEPGDGEVGRGSEGAPGLQNVVRVTLVQPRRLTIIFLVKS